MGRGFNSEIIRREKSEIVQNLRPAAASAKKARMPAHLLARSLVRVRSPLPRRLHFTRALGANVVSTSLTVKKADIK